MHSLLLARSGSGTDKSTCHVACGKSQDTASELTPLSTIPRTIGYLTYHMQISRACSGVYSTLRKTTLPAPPAISPSLSLDSNRALVAACAREVSQPDATPAPTIATVHMPHSSPARDGTRHSKRHSKRAPHTGSNTASLISLVCRTGRRCGMRARHPFVWIASAGPIWRHRNRTAASLIHHSRPPPLNPPPQRHTATLPQRRHRSAALLTRTHAE